MPLNAISNVLRKTEWRIQTFWPQSTKAIGWKKKQHKNGKKASFTQLCSACEAGDCGVGLWPPWPLWGLRLGRGWLEWEWLKKCLCWHPLAADDRKSQTSSCLLASVKSNLNFVCESYVRWFFVSFWSVSHGFASSCLLSHDMEHWVNTLHSSSLRYPKSDGHDILSHCLTNINLFHLQRVSLELVVADYDRWP